MRIPGDCLIAWRALSGIFDPYMHRLRGGWYGTRDLFALTNRPSTERKVRKLRECGLVDWRKVPDRITGGCFVEYRIAADPPGREIVPQSDQPILSEPTPSRSGETAAPVSAGLLFDLPPPDREYFERRGRTAR